MKRSTTLLAWLVYSVGASILLAPLFGISLKALGLGIIIGFFGSMLNSIILLLDKANQISDEERRIEN